MHAIAHHGVINSPQVRGYLTENTCEDERVVRLNEDVCDAMGLPWCAPVRRRISRRKAELKQVCVPLMAADGR